jgi:hypothetical protein
MDYAWISYAGKRSGSYSPCRTARSASALTRKTTPSGPRDVSHALVLAASGPRDDERARLGHDWPTRSGRGRPAPGRPAAAQRQA